MENGGSTLLRGGTWFLAAVALFAVGVTISTKYDVQFGIERRASHMVEVLEVDGYVPSYTVRPGPQLQMLYVGSSTCGWSNVPELPEAVEAIKQQLAATAEEHGMTFQAVGLALDWVPSRGVEHLEKFGAFDEIATGNNWGNSLALSHLWTETLAPPSTPLVVVARRTFFAPLSEEDPMIYEEFDREVLHVVRGSDSIVEWASTGASFDLREPVEVAIGNRRHTSMTPNP